MEKNFQNEKTYYMPKGLFEYLLIVSPGKEVYDKIMEEKQYFSGRYDQPVAINTKPHITVSGFLAWDNMEETLTRRLQYIAKEQRSFYVTLNNYSGFPSHTVYIRIQDPAPFKELTSGIKAIAPYIKEQSFPPSKFISSPHLSIARRLPLAVYENAIKDYSEKNFNASFEVTELVLLRRQHQYDIYKQAGVFRLQPSKYNN
jgi:2'-5' RNA ligase